MGRAGGFIPFIVVGLVHLASLGAGWLPLAFWSKALLMPSLLLALLIGLPRWRSEFAAWGSLALVFATLGDVLLGSPGELGFLIGVGAFLLAHVAYIVLFLRPTRLRPIPWHAAIIAAWLVVFLVLLLPHTGALAVPVVLYAVIVCVSAMASFGTTPLIMMGAVLFLVSDSLLGFRMFYPGFEFWQQDVVIMALYIAGQGLMIAGTVIVAQRNGRTLSDRP